MGQTDLWNPIQIVNPMPTRTKLRRETKKREVLFMQRVASRSIPLPRDRRPQCATSALPENTVIVSADGHWSVSDDIFFERFPARLKSRAPRLSMTDAGYVDWQVDGKSLIPSALASNLSAFDCVPGSTKIEPRLRDMDVEGVSKELLFGNGIGIFYNYPDLEVRSCTFEVYNEHLADVQKHAPGRLYGVGLINFWDMNEVAKSIDRIKALGIKTLLLPQNPAGAAGKSLNYCSPEMAPLWEALEDSGLPICFHVGEFFADGPGGVGTTSLTNFGPFRKNFGQLVFGGIFDRHPNLKVVFVEADINWIPGMLQCADAIYDRFPGLLQPEIKHRPTYYWHNNCYATIMSDPVGLKMMDLIGPGRVLWAGDYPHQEGVFGETWDSYQAIVETVTASEARAILGGTAIELFGLDK
jgi:predicted TIM-barrel fold metal-dependent hydrolase